MFSRAVTQGIPQSGDVSRNVSVFNDRIRPDELNHLIFREDVSAVLNENEKDVEDFRGQWHNFTVAQKLPLACINAKRTEFIGRLGLPQHDWVSRSVGIFRNLSEL